jgi:Tc5 transposase-like DNA-binding protein
VLIKYINKLSDRGILPTSQIVKNIAEEIIGGELGKNWVGQFVKRHKDEITSLYLQKMDKVRVKSEYAPIFKQFYDLVTYLFLYYCLFSLIRPT